jgi:hypothetical protein
MQRAINYFLTTYGFSDLDSASKVFYWGQSSPNQSSSTASSIVSKNLP